MIINRKLTGPGHFTGHTGTPAISCSFKAAAGYLYPLERGFIYVHKPPIHIRFEEIASVNFARGGGSTRSFDFEIELTSGVVHTFSSIEKEEYGKLFDFITSKKLRVKNRGKSDKLNYDEDFGDSDQEDEPDAYLARVKAEAQEREDGEANIDSEEGSTDEDFNPNQVESDVAEEYDSNPNSSDSEEDSDASAASHKKEKKEKKEKKSKSAKTVSEKPRKQRKPKKEKDANRPKKPQTAFMLWLNSERDSIKADNPGIAVTEIAKKGGEMWRELKDKSEWEAKAAKAKKEYAVLIKEYEASGGSKTKEKKPEKKKKEPTKKDSPSKQMTGTSFKSKEYISDDDSSSDESKKSEKKRSDNESEDEKDRKKKPEKRPTEEAGKKPTKKGKRSRSDESDAEEPIESTPSSSDAESKNSD